jgi:hypothetical protein
MQPGCNPHSTGQEPLSSGDDVIVFENVLYSKKKLITNEERMLASRFG